MFEKYGVEYAMQHEEFLNASISSCKRLMAIKKYNSIFGELKYQTEPELLFIKYCELKNIYVQNGPKLKYLLKGKLHFYYVDFETQDFLVEIKASHYWYFKHLEEGRIDAKNRVARIYCNNHNKKFLFVLDNYNFEDILKGEWQ